MGVPVQHNTDSARGTSEILRLAALITASVEDIVKEYKLVGETIPSLYSIDPGYFDEPQNLSPNLSEAIQVIEAACAQLCCTVANPGHVIVNKSNTYQEPVGLQIVTSAKVADILLQSPEGLHIDAIALQANLDAGKLGRILRMLATKHCFVEVRPNVFANNRISIQLVSTDPVASYVEHITDQPFKSIVHLNGTLTDPKTGFSSSPNDSTFQRVHGVPIFGSVEKPMETKARNRFAKAMVGWSNVTARLPLSQSYPWNMVPADSVVCDFGGGNGHATLGLVQEYPSIKVVLQDLPDVVEQGIIYWKAHDPESVENGRVQFVGINFFSESPVAGCDFYYLRHVLHDWPTKECIYILQNIRKAMSPSSKLLIHEYVLQSALKQSTRPNQAPEPLLSNFGVGCIRRYNQDINMMNVLNGQERTLQEFIDMGHTAGFKFETVRDSGEEGLIEFCVM